MNPQRPTDPAALRRAAEACLNEQPADHSPQSGAELPGLRHELEVHQIELELQNAELLAARGELEASLERYTDLYDCAPVGYFNLTADGVIRLANLTGAGLMGLERGRLVGRRLGQFVAEVCRKDFSDFLATAFATEVRQTTELAMAGEGRAPWVARFDAILSPDRQECRVVVTDITERRRTEAALGAGERLHASILDSLDDHIAVLDPQGVIVAVNRAWRQFAVDNGASELGTRSVGMNYLAVCEVAPKLPAGVEAAAVRAGLLAVLSGERALFQMEYPCHSPAEERWFQLSVNRLIGTGGGAVVSHRDITVRRQAEKTLEMMRFSVDRAGDSIFWLTREGRIRYANDAACVSRGYSREELLGMSIFDLDPDYQPGVWGPHFEDLKRRGTLTLETRHRTKDGRIFPIEVNANYVFINGQEFNFCFLRDITARKAAEAALRASEARYRRVELGTNDGLWEWNIATGKEYCSPRWLEMLGYAAGDRPADFASFSSLIHPDDVERAMAASDRSIRDGQSFKVEMRLRRKDGGYLWVLSRAKVDYDEAGKPLTMTGSITDLTATRELEQQLRQSQKLEAIGTLAGGIAHDFNNILGAILGNVQLASLDTGEDHPARESLEEIRKAGLRAKGLVQQILAFSRRQPQERRVISLGPLLAEVSRFLHATIPAGVEIATVAEGDVPPVLADATQMLQVLVNLGTNAWHALEDEPGRIELGLRTVDLDATAVRSLAGLEPGRFVCLSVRDSGKGMDEATCQRIFEPFFTTKAPGKGTGLGLSVVHGVVQGHEGAISVTSQPGRGSTFEVYLPVAMVPAAAENAAPPQTLPGGRRHVLVLDDEVALVSSVRRLLGRLGHQVTGFTSAEEALAAFQTAPGQFDLVITDYNMPGMSGLAVAAAFLSLRPEVPVLLNSGHVTEELLQRARTAGIREVLRKPNTMEELTMAIHRQFPAIAAT